MRIASDGGTGRQVINNKLIILSSSDTPNRSDSFKF